MKNVKFLILPLIMFIAASCNVTSGGTSVDSTTSSGTSTGSGSNVSTNPGDYYDSISDSLMGQDLLNALRKLNASERTSTVGYSGMSDTKDNYYYTDYDPSTAKIVNGVPKGTTVLAFYSGTKTRSWNREHTWPNSHGGNLIENDIHMTRPTIPSENGSRGNSFYVEGKRDQSRGWDPAMESFGVESYRGDSARIIFYGVIANSRLSIIDDDYHPTTNKNRDNLMGKISDMLKWNLTYPVLQREENRNIGAEYLQGNRNPFIDHPEYACRIWSNFNANTKRICG